MHRAALILRRVLAAIALLCLGSWTGVKVYAHVQSVRNEDLLEHLIGEHRHSSTPSEASTRLPAHDAPLRQGDLLGRIDVPSVGLSAFVLEGTGERWLEQGAGHVPGTALPGAEGNAVVAGHRDSFFRGLRRIELGDVVTVTTPTATRRYAVDSFHVVDPEDIRALAPSTRAELTLVTCFPFTYVGAAPRRFIVHAHAIALDDASRDRAGAASLAPGRLELLSAPSSPPQKKAPPMRPSPSAREARRDRLPSGAQSSFAPISSTPKRLPWWKRLFHRGNDSASHRSRRPA